MISKISKPFAMLTFMLKEIVDFNTKLTSTGIPFSHLRNKKIRLIEIMQYKDKMRDLLEKN